MKSTATHRKRGECRRHAAAEPTPAPSTRRAERDAVIRVLAAAQHGVVARAQLRTTGLPPHAIDQRVRDGRLVGLYRGVYRVIGPVVGAREAEMGAVLACGDGALLSHRSAAALWSLTPPPPPPPLRRARRLGRRRPPEPGKGPWPSTSPWT